MSSAHLKYFFSLLQCNFLHFYLQDVFWRFQEKLHQIGNVQLNSWRAGGWRETKLDGVDQRGPLGERQLCWRLQKLPRQDFYYFTVLKWITTKQLFNERTFSRHVLDQPSVPAAAVRRGRPRWEGGALHCCGGSDAEGSEDAAPHRSQIPHHWIFNLWGSDSPPNALLLLAVRLTFFSLVFPAGAKRGRSVSKEDGFLMISSLVSPEGDCNSMQTVFGCWTTFLWTHCSIYSLKQRHACMKKVLKGIQATKSAF